MIPGGAAPGAAPLRNKVTDMNTDKPLGATLIGIGLAGIAITTQISARTFNDDPGPQLFPYMACAILVLCGLGMLVISKPQPLPEPGPEGGLGRGAVMSGLLVLYAVGLWLVGFHIATPLMIYAFYHVIAGPQDRRLWIGAVFAVAATLGVHLVFSTFLNTLLPQGILF